MAIDRSFDNVKLVYILYFVGFLFPLVALGGLIVAYVNIKDAPPAAQSHYTFQIRSFWIGLAAAVLSVVLWVILLGWLVGLIWVIWALVRFVTGIMKAGEGRPVDDPETWGFTA